MVDLTNNKIRPFFHIKNFKDGVADAVLGRAMTKAGRSSGNPPIFNGVQP